MKIKAEMNDKATELIPVIVQRYGLLQQKSTLTWEMFNTWYRPDMLLFIERYVMGKGKVVDKFRILPNTNDFEKIGHINFTKLYFDDFEDAAKTLININVA